MNEDPASLDRLRNIVPYEPVAWWPLAPGWWVLAGVLLIAVGWWGVRAWRRWQANAWRREALAGIDRAQTAAEVSVILKRAAMAVYPRNKVAALSGQAWCAWLASTGKTAASDAVAVALTRGVYGGREDEALTELVDFARGWIEAQPARRLNHGRNDHDA